jgi:hypothetical protein
MASHGAFIANPKNRQVLSWVGGGIVAVAAGAWAVVTYVWPAHETPKAVCAQQGVVVGGNVSGSTLANTATGSPSSGPCVETKKDK